MTRPNSQDSSREPAGSQPDKASPHTSDHLANERTFLAWIRTSIAVLGLGFVVAKFSVWLRELSARLDEPVRAKHTGLSLPLGVAMMALGGLLAVIAAWRYRHVRAAIDSGKPTAGGHTVTIVAIMVLAITAALIAYMIATK